MFEDKLVDKIYKWVAAGGKVPREKEKLLKVMIKVTLDYLRLHKMVVDKIGVN